MSKFRSSSFLLPVVMFFLSTYLFCCLTNLFVIPRNVPSITGQSFATAFHHRRNSFETTKQALNFIGADKFVLNESQIDLIRLTPFFLVFFPQWVSLFKELILYPPSAYLFSNKQHSYLFYSTFRI